MRLSYTFQQVLKAVLLISLIVYTVWLLFLLHNSPFARNFPVVYGGVFVLFFILEVLAYKIAMPFAIGQGGEAIVHALLRNLPRAYVSLHDVTLGEKGNIDEVVISPNGIWTLEVKNYKDGEITFENGVLCRNHYPINGDGKPLTQAYAEAINLQNHIRETLELYVPVTPVLIFANSKNTMKFGLEPINGVFVIGVDWLQKLLVPPNLPSRITPENCVAISDELRKYTSIM